MYVHPPTNLLQETKVEGKVPRTVGELKLALVDSLVALGQCNADKDEVLKYGLAFK